MLNRDTKETNQESRSSSGNCWGTFYLISTVLLGVGAYISFDAAKDKEDTSKALLLAWASLQTVFGAGSLGASVWNFCKKPSPSHLFAKNHQPTHESKSTASAEPARPAP